MKIRKTKNLTTSLIIITTTILLVLNLLAAAFISVYSGAAMNNKQDAYLKEMGNSAKRQVEQFVEQYKSIADTMVNNHQLQVGTGTANKETPLSATDAFADITGTMKETIAKYTHIMGMGIGSVEEDTIYSQDGSNYNLVLSERPYYSAVTSNTQVLTQPYADTVTGEMCISIATPISYNGKVTGLLVMDLMLDQFSNYLAEMAFGETGRLILIDSEENIIGAEDAELLGKGIMNIGITGEGFVNELESPTGLIEKYELNGEKRAGLIVPIDELGWKVIVAMSDAEYGKDTNSMVLALAGLLIAVTVIVIFVIRAVLVKKLRPITQLNDGLKRMSQGHLDIQITHKGDDEIGEMADSLRSSVKTLSTYVNAIANAMGELASGNLDVSSPIQFKGDFAPIQTSIDAFIAKLTHLMRNIHNASEQVATGADQVSSGAQALSQGATEQASSVQELAATIADISQTVKNNTQMVLEATENANKTNGDIRESGRKMKESLEVMSEIKASSNEISKIIKTIEDIAFQTNILALNAAVEAARAGSAGKGFAVVADEVRNLAGKSAEASQTTTALIETSLAAVEKGTLSMEETARSMESVVSEAQKITDVFGAIASASDEQANSIAQVTLGIDQISGVVQTNSATAEESAAASEELSGQAQLLNSLLSQFKIPQTGDDYGMGTVQTSMDMPVDTVDDFDMNGGYTGYSNDKY